MGACAYAYAYEWYANRSVVSGSPSGLHCRYTTQVLSSFSSDRVLSSARACAYHSRLVLNKSIIELNLQRKTQYISSDVHIHLH